MKELYFDALKERGGGGTHPNFKNIRFINIIVMNILSTDLFTLDVSQKAEKRYLLTYLK